MVGDFLGMKLLSLEFESGRRGRGGGLCGGDLRFRHKVAGAN